METISCRNCEGSIRIDANFCNHCGVKVKCKECQSPIMKGDKFCSNCGVELNSSSSNGQTHKNTVSYYKNNEETRCEVSLSDDVAKDGIQSLIENIVGVPNRLRLANSDMSEQEQYITLDDTQAEVVQSTPTNSSPNLTQDGQFIESVNQQYEHIDDLIMKKDFGELQWILIFAFYESDFGKKNFTYETVRTAYLSKRKSESRLKNFKENWNKVFKSYFKTITQNVFGFENSKLSAIHNLAMGDDSQIIFKATGTVKKTVKAKEQNQDKSTDKKVTKSAKHIQYEEFDTLKSDTKPSLEEFYSTYQPQINQDIFGLIAYYMHHFCNKENFNAGNIDYAFRTLKLQRKNNLVQAITNAKNDSLWFDRTSQGVWCLNRKGIVELETKFNIEK
ncbi:zinc ribbon domain-containing protein [Edaphocola flava]|uniref:zinc ribbon domain-containing protein n=1 Tax=Edaphocola flava TaxID=2499629 RepID=UPI00100B7A6E|nr:zinc ribbon domain-containing protein [Edaphocola flava]